MARPKTKVRTPGSVTSRQWADIALRAEARNFTEASDQYDMSQSKEDERALKKAWAHLQAAAVHFAYVSK